MKDLNSVQVIGRLGQDPSVTYTDTGTARTTFSVATNRTWTDADGQVQTETEWTRCTTWGKLAEIAALHAHKGSRVYVAGRLHTSRWEDAQTGEARSSVEIVVDDLILLDRPTPHATADDEQDAGEPREPAAAQQPIRRPQRPVELAATTAQPAKRRRNDH